MILLGEADVVLTGGMESMSQAPHVIRGLRSGLRLGQGQLEDTLWSALLDTHCGCTMAATAENCAAKYGVSREEQDRYAIRSQQLADKAWKEGRLDGRSRPGRDQVAQGRRAVRAGRPHAAGLDDGGAGEAAGGVQQERLRHGRQRQSGIVDGGAALLLASAKGVKEHGLTPLARLTHWAYVGVEPTLMGMGPAPATRHGAREGRPVARRTSI